MNAIDLLDTQHLDIDDLFARLERSEAGDASRQKLFDDLADLLAIHATIEELHFYPAVRAARTEEILEHSLQEHVGIKRKLALCMASPVGSSRFAERLRALADEVHHHVGDERAELFPKVRRIFDRDQLEAIGQEMTSTMAQLQQGRPRFDVPLQTIAPMPLTEVPAQGNLSSRIVPRISRFLALPLQLFGVAKLMGRLTTDFIRGVRHGLTRIRRREA
jgi:hemerythrin-like domain-containing protein